MKRGLGNLGRCTVVSSFSIACDIVREVLRSIVKTASKKCHGDAEKAAHRIFYYVNNIILILVCIWNRFRVNLHLVVRSFLITHAAIPA